MVATVPVGDNPQAVIFNLAGTFAYVNNSGSGYTSVIDTSSNSVVANISVSGSGGMAVNPIGGEIYITNGGLVSVINPNSNSILASIVMGGDAAGVAVNRAKNVLSLEKTSSVA